MDDRQKELLKRIENDFLYHAPKPGQAERYESNRRQFLDLARLIVLETPSGREQSLALTSLEETMFWTNAAIARSE